MKAMSIERALVGQTSRRDAGADISNAVRETVTADALKSMSGGTAKDEALQSSAGLVASQFTDHVIGSKSFNDVYDAILADSWVKKQLSAASTLPASEQVELAKKHLEAAEKRLDADRSRIQASFVTLAEMGLTTPTEAQPQLLFRQNMTVGHERLHELLSAIPAQG